MEENISPKVFISYSHKDKEYENIVLKFTDKLRKDGIDANIDLYEESPEEGWPLWTERQIENSDYVLIVNDKSYFDKVNEYNKLGKGVMWEITVVYQHLYDSKMTNKKFIPIFFNSEDEQYILTPLKLFTFYNVSKDDQYEKLYLRLIGKKVHEKPALGNIKSLPVKKQRKTFFFINPINIELWDEAKWNGAIYSAYDDRPPLLMLTYKNFDAAVEIFKQWKEKISDRFADDFLSINIIERPFPEKCWVNYEKDRNFGVGYFIHIGANATKILELINSFDNDKDKCLLSFSRFQWMDELNGTYYRDTFIKAAKSYKEFLIVPAHIIDDTKQVRSFDDLQIDFKYCLRFREIGVKQGINLSNNDLCNVVLNNPNV